MKKILQEKRTLWKKIMSWILVMAILFTSADLSVFTVGAEESAEFSSEANEDTEKPAIAAESVTAEDMAETAQQDLTETGTEVFSDSADFSDSGEDLTEEIPQGEMGENIFSDGSVSPEQNENQLSDENESNESDEDGNQKTEEFTSEETPEDFVAEPDGGTVTEELYNFTLKVFEDANKNGVWDENEKGAEGIDADVRNADFGYTVSAMKVVEPGVYNLKSIPKGTYHIMLTASPETVSLYNLTESISTSSQKDSICFPEPGEEWFLSYENIDITKTNEICLGLQRDDLEAIEEEIGSSEDMDLFVDGESGNMMFSTGASARGVDPWNFVYKAASDIICWGSKVNVKYHQTGTIHWHENSEYNWIWNASDPRHPIAYCIGPFVNPVDTGHYNKKGNFNDAFVTTELADYCRKVAYYGADYPWPEMVNDRENARAFYFMAAQTIIWQNCGADNIKWTFASNGNEVPLQDFINRILKKVENHDKKPSLPSDYKINHHHESPYLIYAVSDKSGALCNTNEKWTLKSIPSGVETAYIDCVRGELNFELKPGTAIDGKQITFELIKKFPKNAPFGAYTGITEKGNVAQALIQGGEMDPITYTWTVTVNPFGSAKIKKVDDAGKPVQGVTFKWGRDRNNLNQVTAATDTEGEVTINTNPGTIYVQEYKVPDHLVKDDTIKSVVVKNGQTSTVTFTNKRKTRYVSLKKTNENGYPVQGAKFRYWNTEHPDKVYTGITNSKGEFFSFVKFPVGSTVVMEETEPAPGYKPLSNNEKRKEIQVQLDEAKNVFKFKNIPKEIPIQFKKINARTGETVPHVIFWISASPDFDSHQVCETDRSGIAEARGFKHGETVYYKEVSCPGRYKLDEKVYSFVVDASKQNVQEIVVYNHEGPIRFSIKKKGDDGRPLEGVRFRIEQFNGSYWYTLYGNLMTNRDGILEIPDTYARDLIAKKWLRLVEESTIPGYYILDKPVYIDPQYANSEYTEITIPIENKKIPTSVVITKTDDKQGAEAKCLQGALFAITDSSGRVVETLTTDQQGTAYTSELLADTQYYIEEVSPPYGYKKMEGRFPLILNKENKYTYTKNFPNEPYYGSIVIHKKDQTGRSLPGIEFTVYKDYLPIAKMVTDINGEASLDKLVADGRYRIVETYAPPQYQFPSFDYTVDFLQEEEKKDEPQDGYYVSFDKKKLEITFDISNEELFGSVTIKKQDAEKRTIPVKGAEFNLYDRFTGEQVGGTQTTNEEGICRFSDLKLVNPTVSFQQGHYYIEEVTPGENHILPEETKKYFALTADNKDITVTFENPPYKGSIEITKVDAQDSSKKLQGAEFAIYCADDPDTEIASRKTTGADGIARFENLRYGTYIIKETKAPKYYRNDPVNGGNKKYWDKTTGGYKVTVDESGPKIIPLEISNPKLQVQVKVVKMDSGKKHKLGRAEFGLYKGDGTLLETIVTAPLYGNAMDGTGISKTYDAEELGEGAYVMETKAPAGYEKDPDKHLITYNQTSEKQVIEIVKEIGNSMATPEFKLQKVDEDGNGVRAGFTIDVLNTTMRYDWGAMYPTSFPYHISTTKEKPIVDLSEFIKAFEQNIREHPENRINHIYMLTFKETYTEAGYQKIENGFANCNFIYRESSGWTIDYVTSFEEGVTYDQNTMTLTVVNKKIPVKLKVVKTDFNFHNPIYLAGAVFRITPIDADGKEGESIEVTSVASEEGVTVELPYAAKYRIEEIKAPPGYWRQMSNSNIKFDSFKYDSNKKEYTYEYKAINFKQPHIEIKKIGRDGVSEKPLKATFRITEILHESGKDKTVTVSTQENGTAVVDFPDDWKSFMGSSNQKGILKIEEISVEDTDYKILKEPVYVGWSKENTSDYSFTTNGLGYQNPDSVTFEKATNSIIITVPNEKKNYQYFMMKQGDSDDNSPIQATVSVQVGDRERQLSISSTKPEEVSDIFSELTDPKGYKVTINEYAASPGYELAPVMEFMYYPEKKGLEKFQHITGPVSFEFNKNNSEQIFIKITNTRAKMRLYLKKVNEKGHLLSGAKFNLKTESPNYEVQYETTGDPAGEYIEFPYAEKIILEEVQAPVGYQIGNISKWELDEFDFVPVKGSNHSLYECRRFLGQTPITNTSTYSLSIKKVDENGNLANATFEIAVPYKGYKWRVSTKEGIADLTTIVGYIMNLFGNEKVVQLEVTEVETEEGLLLHQGTLAVINVYPPHISGSGTEDYFMLSSSMPGVTLEEPGSTYATLQLKIKNNPLPVNLTLIKEDKENPGTYLANAVFEITCHGGKSDGKKIDVTTTNTAQGQTVTLPWAESYSVREITAPEGYILDPTVYDYTIRQFEDQKEGAVLVAKNKKVTYTNAPIKGKIQITKIDADDSRTLGGAEFDIYKGPLKEGHGYETVKEGDYQKVSSITIDSGGIGKSNELPYGDYLLKETKAPDGYQITKEIYPVKISKEAETVYVQVPNEKLKGTLKIIKKDSETQELLANAVFTVHRSEDNVQIGDPLVTGADGTISVQLPYGDYYFKEVSFPSGYVPAAGKTYDFTLSGTATTAEVIVPNQKASYALRLFKRDGNTGEYLADAEFGLFNEGESPKAGDTPIQTFTTNANGSAVVFLDHAGNYDIYELKPPSGYQKNEQKYSVTVTDNEPTVEIVADNTKQLLNIDIHKTDETGATLLPGAVFEIRNAKTGALVATTGATGENGMVSVEVPAGDFEYTVTEIQAPEGYVLDSTPVPVEIIKKEENGQVTYEAKPITRINKKAKGNIKLVKTDETGQKPLEGAVFGVYKEENSEPIETLTTNSKGEAMSGNLDHGKYYLQEITPPEGYEKSEERYPVELTETTRIEIVKATNTAKKGDFKVLKVEKTENGNQPIKGKTAEFKVFASYEDAQNLKNEKQVASTDVDTGIAAFTDLPYGIYYARETKAPEGYKLSDRIYTVTVDENSAETVILEVENYKEPEEGIFRVRKKDADTGAALAGAVFTVEGPIGENSKTYTYTTAKDGTFTTDPLEPGTYTVTETKAPGGYRISDPASQIVEVKAGDGIKSPIVEISFANKKIELSVTVIKTDETGTTHLPGAVFELYKADVNNQPVGSVLESLTTDMEGKAVSAKLPPGKYLLKEVTPPTGYELAEDHSRIIEITETTQETELVYTFKNSQKKGRLEILKSGKEYETSPDAEAVPLAGAVFEAYNPALDLRREAVSDKNGLAVFKDLPYGIYQVSEIKVPEGYRTDKVFVQTVEVGDNNPVIKLTAYNYRLHGSISLKKTDSETGVLVGGARYGIYTEIDEDGQVVEDKYLGKEFDLVTSGTDAYVTSQDLPLGIYYVKEIQSPPGYHLNETVYKADLTSENPIFEVDAQDEPKKGKVIIHKKDDSTPEKPLEGAIFALYKEEDFENLPEDGLEIPALYATTNQDGIAEFNNLTVGQTYVLKEYRAPEGYEMSADKYEFIPAVEPKEELIFDYTFVNKNKTELIIHKKGENGEIISDVMFAIYAYGADNLSGTDDDEFVAYFAPSIYGDGIARYDISGLKEGWYYVKETQGSSEGFVPSEDIVPFQITAEKKDIEFDFINYRPKGEIEIQKKDEQGRPLKGAEFALYRMQDGWPDDPEALELAYEIPMDDNGYGILRDIPAGVYLLRETKVPVGYKQMPDKQIFMYQDGEKQKKNGKVYYHCHEDVVNKPISGQISVQKRAVLNGKPVEDMDLSNAKFTITNEKNEVVDTLITGHDGTAVSRELPEGIYTIRETKAPEGTSLNAQEKEVRIDGTATDDIYTYIHDNQVVKGKIRIKKVDADHPEKTLEGAEFSILKDGETEPITITIGENGTGTSQDLPYGWYTIRETKTPEGYILNTSLVLRCQIREEDQTVELTVENFKESEPGNYEIIVVKHDKDNPNRYLAGAKFDLYSDEQMSNKINTDSLVTDNKGRIKFGQELKDKLQAGNMYYLKETEAPEGYILDETLHPFTLTASEPGGALQSIALYLSNEKHKGYVKFEKTGEILSDIKPAEPSGYPELHSLVWKPGKLENAEIGIYADQEVELDGKIYREGDLIQRLKSGEISRPLPLGKYKYKELAAPDEYVPDQKFHEITVMEGSTELKPDLAKLDNKHASLELSLHKKFEDEDTKERFAAVKFGVYADRDIVSYGVTIPENTLLHVFGVDENGAGRTELKLPNGGYYVKEIATAQGYVLDGKHYPFTLISHNKDQKIEISSEQAPIVNERVYGAIRLEKTGEMFTGVQRLVNQEGKYQVNKPVYSKGELKGAEVQIKATTEITIGDKIYREGDVVDTLISGEKDESIKLPLGTYTLVETKAPEGYVLDTKEHSVTIEANATPNQPSVAIHKLENKKAIPKIQLYKSFFGQTDAEAKDLYERVLFGVYAKEDIRGASSDAVLRKDELVGLIRMKEDGTGTLTDDTLLPFGSYYVKELETAEDYQVSDKEYPFTVNAETMGSSAEPEGTPETGEESVYREILIEGISKDNPVINSPEDAKVPFAFLKTGEDGTPLPGAVFRLYTCDNKEEGHQHSADAANANRGCWTEVEGVSPKTSGADGIVDFGILPDGIYQLKETEAPDGYVLPAGQWRFTVDSTAAEGKHIEFKSTGGAKPPAFQKAEDGAVYQYQVSNRKAMPMPFTGGAGLPAYLGGGGALVALSELMRRRRKNKK